MLRIAVCDDSESDRKELVSMLKPYLKRRKLSADITEYEMGECLVELYDDGKKPYDIIFLDIYMSKLNGIEAARRIREYDERITIIFLTTSPDYAIDSYQVRAFFYLMKPLKSGLIEKVMDCYVAEKGNTLNKSLLLVSQGVGKRIFYRDIIYIESRNVDLYVVCSGNREYKFRLQMKAVISILDEPDFLRCNQSYIINMNHVIDVETDFLMSNGVWIPIKVRERKRIRDSYYQYMLLDHKVSCLP